MGCQHNTKRQAFKIEQHFVLFPAGLGPNHGRQIEIWFHFSNLCPPSRSFEFHGVQLENKDKHVGGS